MSDSVVERVARGAALLDAQYLDWHKAIDLRRLRFNDFTRCVAAQVGEHFNARATYRPFDHYHGVADAIGSMADDDPVAVGFMSEHSREDAALEAAWEHEIERRLHAES